MGLSNQQIVEKTDFALAGLGTSSTAGVDSSNTGGIMGVGQTRQFVRKLIAQPTLLNQARVRIMSSPTEEVNKVQFANRILKPAGTTAEGGSTNNRPARFLLDTDRSEPETSKIMLNTTEVMAEVRLPYEVLEDNIEGQSFQDTVMELIVERAAVDLEELAIQGDTGSGDAYLALKNGFLLQSVNNTVNAASVSIGKTIFRDAIKNLPDAYHRNRANMRFFISFDQDANLRHTLADRATTGGDSFLLSETPIRMFGIPVEPVSLMPNTDGLFADNRNHIFGIWRRILVETARDIRSREFVIVISYRVEFKLEETLAEVRIQNIGV